MGIGILGNAGGSPMGVQGGTAKVQSAIHPAGVDGVVKTHTPGMRVGPITPVVVHLEVETLHNGAIHAGHVLV